MDRVADTPRRPAAADERLRSERVRYSICTLVTRMDEYEALVASFEAGGFAGADCEYLYLDNTRSNAHDAYAGYNLFLTVARGDYIVLCHQDVVLLEDGRAALDRVLDELTRADPSWGLCGNAGGVRPNEHVVRITDPYGADQRVGAFPARVTSLDENFIVVRRDANLALSSQLRGFHLYGAELCIVADVLGRTAYVVDFHLRHKSGGNVDAAFLDLRARMIERYRTAFRARWITTTCTTFFVSGVPLLDRIAHSRVYARLQRIQQRLGARRVRPS